MIMYKDGRLIETEEKEINKNNLYGYIVAEHSYPHDNEIHEAETYEEAIDVLNIINKEEPNRKIYIREITEEEFNRVVNLRVYAEMGD